MEGLGDLDGTRGLEVLEAGKGLEAWKGLQAWDGLKAWWLGHWSMDFTLVSVSHARPQDGSADDGKRSEAQRNEVDRCITAPP